MNYLENKISCIVRHTLVHISHTCTLAITHNNHHQSPQVISYYYVIDTQERIKGAMMSRGNNRIIILDHNLSSVETIKYISERPLYCDNQYLFVLGYIDTSNLFFLSEVAADEFAIHQAGKKAEGNRITFNAKGMYGPQNYCKLILLITCRVCRYVFGFCRVLLLVLDPR